MMSARRLRFANRAALHATSAARPRTARRRSRASLQAAWRSDASRPLCAYRLAAEAGQAQSSLETAPASPMLRLVQGGARVTRAAHLLWTEVVQPGDLVVDATCGNGHDTLALAQLVGPRGTVHAFDLQPAAIDSTRSQLNDHCKDGAAPAVHLHCESHAQMRERVPDDSAALVAFNLGYLPHGNHSVVTEAATTTVAVRSALQCLKAPGLCTIIAYVGHEQGDTEHAAVVQLLQALPSDKFVCQETTLLNRSLAPRLLSVWKVRSGASTVSTDDM